MFSLSLIVLIVLVRNCHSFGEFLGSNVEPFSMDISPPITVKETLLQCFKCKNGSELRKLLHYSSYDDTSSCNDWKLTKNNALFNMTLGSEVMELRMSGLTTYTVHLNGNLLLIQNGMITEGVCKGGYFEKFVFNAVDQSGCPGNGITKQIPIYGLVTITGGRCEAKCPGRVSVWFDPPVRNRVN